MGGWEEGVGVRQASKLFDLCLFGSSVSNLRSFVKVL